MFRYHYGLNDPTHPSRHLNQQETITMLWECAVCNYQFEDDWAVCPECGATECFELEEDDFSDDTED
jgi:rubrerythrin